MAIEVFNRYENKYLMDTKIFTLFITDCLNIWNSMITTRTINSIR